MGIVVR